MAVPGKIRRRAIAFAAIGACAVLGGCADLYGARALSYADYAGAPVQDFFSYHLDGWEATGRNQLVLWSGVDQAYLVEVWQTCPDLRYAHRVAVTSTAHTISHLDYVRVDGDSCPISQIRPIDLKAMNADRVKIASLAG